MKECDRDPPLDSFHILQCKIRSVIYTCMHETFLCGLLTEKGNFPIKNGFSFFIWKIIIPSQLLCEKLVKLKLTLQACPMFEKYFQTPGWREMMAMCRLSSSHRKPYWKIPSHHPSKPEAETDTQIKTNKRPKKEKKNRNIKLIFKLKQNITNQRNNKKKTKNKKQRIKQEGPKGWGGAHSRRSSVVQSDANIDTLAALHSLDGCLLVHHQEGSIVYGRGENQQREQHEGHQMQPHRHHYCCCYCCFWRKHQQSPRRSPPLLLLLPDAPVLNQNPSTSSENSFFSFKASKPV